MKIILKRDAVSLEEVPNLSDSSSLGFDSFELVCDTHWRSLKKTVRFKHEKSVDIHDIPMAEEGESYYIPSEVLRGGTVYVSVVGVGRNGLLEIGGPASFSVSEACGISGEPTVPPSAYARYVNAVSEYAKRCRDAEERAADCLRMCKLLAERLDADCKKVCELSSSCRRIYTETEGMLDAIGCVYGDIMKLADRLSSADGRLEKNEKQRQNAESARQLSEKRRADSELRRQEAEQERRAAEGVRASSENVRVWANAERERRFALTDERLTELEDTVTSPDSLIQKEYFAEGGFSVPDGETLTAVTFFGKTVIEDGCLKGVGEGGALDLTLNGEEISLPLSAPLHGIEGIADTLTVTADGGVSLLRRIALLSFDGREDIADAGAFPDSRLYAVMPGCPPPDSDSCIGISNALDFGCESEGDCVWINSDCVFFGFASDICSSTADFAKWLSEKKISVAYPMHKTAEEKSGSIAMPKALPVSIKFNGKFSVKTITKKGNDQYGNT